MKQKQICIIVFGMSGAGKNQMMKCLEDIGFIYVDNLPVHLFQQFCEKAIFSDQSNKVAICLNTTNTKEYQDIFKYIEVLKLNSVDVPVLFLNATDKTLIQRFSETRRRHPLNPSRIQDGISRERKELNVFQEISDRTIFTDNINIKQFKNIIMSFLPEKEFSRLHVTIVSFAYKHGIPQDVDMVIDVRFLDNPYYIEELKYKTGLQKQVCDYVENSLGAKTFVDKFLSIINETFPLFEKQGRLYMVFAVGCTGGIHRSVVIANMLYKQIKSYGYMTRVIHRELEELGEK